MLKKLLKYELKNNFNFLTIFYSLALFFAILTRILFSIENSLIINIIAQICSGITISMIFNILINNIMRIWVRFKQSLYGDESYLTHTLPIKKETLYTSKIINTIITLFTSILVIGLTLFIAYYSKDNLTLVKNILLPIANTYNSTITKMLIALLIILFLEFANIIQTGFTGIILGHKMNNTKTGFSVLFGFGTYMAIQTIVLLIIFIVALFNPDLMASFTSNNITNISILKTIIYLSSGIYTITFIINYLININIFKKGVNID